MVAPEVFAIRPRIPASWRIWAFEPRAPESAIMKIGLNSSIAAVWASATALVVSFQMRITRSFRSDSESRPLSYWRLTLRAAFSASATSCFFSSGMVASETATVMPDLVEYW